MSFILLLGMSNRSIAYLSRLVKPLKNDMKKRLFLPLAVLLALPLGLLAQVRYVDDIFNDDDIVVTEDVTQDHLYFDIHPMRFARHAWPEH